MLINQLRTKLVWMHLIFTSLGTISVTHRAQCLLKTTALRPRNISCCTATLIICRGLVSSTGYKQVFSYSLYALSNEGSISVIMYSDERLHFESNQIIIKTIRPRLFDALERLGGLIQLPGLFLFWTTISLFLF